LLVLGRRVLGLVVHAPLELPARLPDGPRQLRQLRAAEEQRDEGDDEERLPADDLTKDRNHGVLLTDPCARALPSPSGVSLRYVTRARSGPPAQDGPPRSRVGQSSLSGPCGRRTDWRPTWPTGVARTRVASSGRRRTHRGRAPARRRPEPSPALRDGVV